jgi:hypothetical protein
MFHQALIQNKIFLLVWSHFVKLQLGEIALGEISFGQFFKVGFLAYGKDSCLANIFLLRRKVSSWAPI